MNGKKLYRNTANKMVGGVCAGLGDFFNIDPTLVRLLYVVLTLCSLGFGVLLYVIMLIVIPEAPVFPQNPQNPQNPSGFNG